MKTNKARKIALKDQNLAESKAKDVKGAALIYLKFDPKLQATAAGKVAPQMVDATDYLLW